MKLPGKSAWLALSFLVILADQLVKAYVSAHMQPFEHITLLPVFNIALYHNTGAAFSMLADASGWQRWFFVVLAVAVTVLIAGWLWRMPAAGNRWVAAGLALVAGGAMGNVWDRLAHGYVVDFLQFHWHSWYFPAFNVADSCITVGAALLILDGLFLERKK
ncbi:MAG: signal peptidase II [Bacillota bacterium]